MALILIVEDAALIRKMLQKILKAEGHTVLEAQNGLQGLQMIRTHNPECIVLDLLMPEMGGRQVLLALRDEGLQIPTIVVTADVQQTTRAECLELGALTVLNKIPKPDELRHWVKKAIGVTTQEGIFDTLFL